MQPGLNGCAADAAGIGECAARAAEIERSREQEIKVRPSRSLDLSISRSLLPRGRLFDCPIDALTMEEALELSRRAINEGRRLRIGVVNAAKLVNMRRDALLRDSVVTSDIVLADGMAVVWASRLLGLRLPERVAGIDLMVRLLERGSAEGYRVFCLGATEEVVSATAELIGERYPGVILAGRRNGYFSESDEAEVAAEIRAARPDILFVAMSSPKKERFLARWGDDLEVSVCHGVGGAFDVLSGKVRRAPRLWQRLGMEWLYRVIQEPRRMWKRYLVTNSVFLWLLAGGVLGRLLGRPGPAEAAAVCEATADGRG